MIIVLTGQPRHGKSQYAIKLLLDLIKDNQKRLEQGKLPREIYCNIAGINDPDTPTKLPEIQNQDVVFKDKKLWFGEHKDCPDGYIAPSAGSVFIYDECHKVDWIKEKSGTLSDNPTCISMNEHGHEDYIFILITQFPQYIHTHLRGLVEYHYHSKRSFGAKGSKIYKWNEFQLNPRAEKSLKDAYEKEKFHFSNKYQNCYKSASAHDSMKINIPKSVIYIMLVVIGITSFAIYKYNQSPLFKKPVNQTNTKPDDSPKQSQEIPTSNTTAQELQTLQDQLTKLQAELELERLQRQQQLYKEQLYQDYQVIKDNPSLQVRGVISNGKDCKAYNAYGDLMNLSKQDCQWYLQEVGRVHKDSSSDSQAQALPTNPSNSPSTL